MAKAKFNIGRLGLMKVTPRRWVVIEEIAPDDTYADAPPMPRFDVRSIPEQYVECVKTYRELARIDAPTRRTAEWVE